MEFNIKSIQSSVKSVRQPQQISSEISLTHRSRDRRRREGASEGQKEEGREGEREHYRETERGLSTQ